MRHPRLPAHLLACPRPATQLSRLHSRGCAAASETLFPADDGAHPRGRPHTGVPSGSRWQVASCSLPVLVALQLLSLCCSKGPRCRACTPSSTTTVPPSPPQGGPTENGPVVVWLVPEARPAWKQRPSTGHCCCLLDLQEHMRAGSHLANCKRWQVPPTTCRRQQPRPTTRCPC